MQSEGGKQILQDAKSGAAEVPLFLILGDRGESIKLAPKSNYNECHNAKEERLVIVSLGTPNTARTLRRRRRGRSQMLELFPPPKKKNFSN